MTYKRLTLLAAFLLPVTGGAALAQTEAPMGDGSGAGPVQFELRDDQESPPVNFRSAHDPRYDTPAQHDAEMYAEQYEKRKAEEFAKEQQFLDKLSKTPRGTGVGAVNPGSIKDGFPAR